ncbi:hypothetical protein CMQ_2566 [Grosmannia clavigera kw1407]|uniref:Zn 2cys6 transcription factor n=1 Tax=Grosmannia clavigera (strain kw1407 / UAMH 11150) TaxID=655863 RepID=F0XI24_GROCL|nr:uncharacterized protein CMQ_2566 [Grosmannia clavigera kw1407]EFX02637.1 hypothetical protein CMQ_2566 [Grosmannia clavigera kw1407]
MGRKPNPIILQFFERGPRLADNSNRYPHRCKACGESFPKGRAESLMTHISKKCPAISEADRINACLSLNGLSHHIAAAAAASAGGGTGVRGAGRMAHQAHRLVGDGSHHGRGNGQAMNHGHGHGHGQHMLPTLGMSAAAAASSPSSTVDAAAIQRDWTALETLAEVSRQIDLSEKHDDRTPGSSGSSGGPGGGEGAAKNEGGNGGGSNMNASGTTTSGGLIAVAPSAFETLEHLGQDVSSLFKTEQNGTAGEREAKRRKYAVSEAESHADARFGLYADDPDAITIEQLKRLEAANLSMAAAAAAQLNPSLLDPQLRSEEAMGPNATRLQQQTTTPEARPWGEITYLAENILPVFPSSEMSASPGDPSRISFHLNNPNEARPRQARARFNTTRRKEVQEVRRIGACIRCRILRKTCSKGSPCDQCRKVLSPRVWRSGCVRTKFTEQLDIFCAGVQVVLAQHRANQLRDTVSVVSRGLLIEATHFPENPAVAVTLEVLQSSGRDDVPLKMEYYMRNVLPEFIRREPSLFVRTLLETSMALAQETNSVLLRKAIELWGLVEILDRERQWQIRVKPAAEGGVGVGVEAPRQIKAETDQETYTTLCLQLTAGAERKAAAISHSLLTTMQRLLQDSKTKIDYSMYFTTLILLSCVEKSTWGFKAWDQESLRATWPLERTPQDFAQQGYVIADLLRMLLGIRRALPRTSCRAEDGMLVTDDEDPLMRNFFDTIKLNYNDVATKQDHPIFSPTDSRSFELLFCSALLLPVRE